ncbi:MAG: nucleotidyltransferase family protein [Candidatus Poribacteria bacterium]
MVTPEKTVKTLLRRYENQQKMARQRAQKAWESLPKLVRILSDNYGAERVILFGSLAREEFLVNSDIDLAVSGMPTENYFKALGHLLMESPYTCDLVTIEDASDLLRQRIEEDGVILYDRERNRIN